MIQNGNSVDIVAQGVNSLDFYWQTDGASGWNPEVVAGTQTTYSAPVVAQNGNGVIISAEGPDNSLDFYWAINGSPTWNPEVVAGAGTTRSAPVIAAAGGWVTIVTVNAIGLGLTGYVAQDGTSTWNVDPNLGIYPSAIVPDMTVFLGWEYVTETGAEGDLDIITISNDEPGIWYSSRIAPDNTAASSPALTFNDDDYNIAFIGGNGNLYFWWAAGGGTWQKETVDTVAGL
ncbi:MAG: hypothetical protein ACRDPD_15230 [Streptosporangiaceae bacterium]